MTKHDPYKLCPECQDFDYNMNRKGGVSSDVLVVCNHEDETTRIEWHENVRCLTSDGRVVNITNQLSSLDD